MSQERLTEFLTMMPPGNTVHIHFLEEDAKWGFGTNNKYISMPEIILHCDSEACSGRRIFRTKKYLNIVEETSGIFIEYLCGNCNGSRKIFSLLYKFNPREEQKEVGLLLEICKIGELPNYGPPIPTKAMSLVGPDRELFLKGRRAENQGLGIAAFAYYRRIIENQWQRFLDEISKVGTKADLDPAVQQHIEAAKAERQFDKAVKSMGDAIPAALKMNGQNPISLLYSALSEGIHAQSDEECLELAGHIRVILYELAERLNSALQEHNELDAAVKRLANRKVLAAKPEK